MEPPPVVPYSPDHRSNTDTSAHDPQRPPESPVHPDSWHRPDPHQPTEPKPQNPSIPYHRHPTHPDPRYQPDPRYPAPTDPRFPSYTERLNQPDGRYSIHTTQDRPAYPNPRYTVTPPRRRPVPENPVHHHTSGPGVRDATFKHSHLCSSFYCEIKSYYWARFRSST